MKSQVLTTLPVAGIFLFDSTGKLGRRGCLSVDASLFSAYPRFNSGNVPASRCGDYSNSIREALLEGLERNEFLKALTEDHSTIIWAVLKFISAAWQEIVCQIDLDAALNAGDIEFEDDNSLLSVLMDGHMCIEQNLAMLRLFLIIAQPQGYAGLWSKPGTRVSTKIEDIVTDIEDLIKRSEKHLAVFQQRIATLAALRSISESGKAIKQADLIGQV